jgi:hypothetical protein
MKKLIALSSVAVAMVAGLVVAHAQMAKTKAPEGAKVYIISPKDGATVTSPFVVEFGLKGMGVAPAGVTNANTGHHHLLIDVATLPDLDKPLTTTDPDHIKHFGGGQTETTLTLPPGKHTLQLVLGDAAHMPHDKPVISEKITVTVK